jgi:LacI family transcriptional regulator
MSSAVAFLLEKRYKKIAFVCNDVSMIQMTERKRAYLEGLQKAGLKPSTELILEVPFADNREGQTKKIQTFLNARKPDAVLFAANYLGVQGLEAIRNLQLKIPADIGIICFDDDELFSMYQPAITVVQQPAQELAKTAVAILMAKLGRNDADPKESVELEAKLIVRHSTK